MYTAPPLFFSGGKDSCYNMVQCVRAGHEIVALANIQPDKGGEEKDSKSDTTHNNDTRLIIGLNLAQMNWTV